MSPFYKKNILHLHNPLIVDFQNVTLKYLPSQTCLKDLCTSRKRLILIFCKIIYENELISIFSGFLIYLYDSKNLISFKYSSLISLKTDYFFQDL